MVRIRYLTHTETRLTRGTTSTLAKSTSLQRRWEVYSLRGRRSICMIRERCYLQRSPNFFLRIVESCMDSSCAKELLTHYLMHPSNVSSIAPLRCIVRNGCIESLASTHSSGI